LHVHDARVGVAELLESRSSSDETPSARTRHAGDHLPLVSRIWRNDSSSRDSM